MAIPYIELKARSAFSFGDSAVSPELLAEHAAQQGYTALGLVDTADFGGIIRFALTAAKHGLRPIIGSELRVDGYPLTLLVRDRNGYRNLAHLITRSRANRDSRGFPGLRAADLEGRGEGLQLLTGPPTGELAALLRSGNAAGVRERIAFWRDVFGGQVAVEAQRHYISGAEESLIRALVDTARQGKLPWVATNEPRYLNDRGRWVHDIQTALRAGMDVSTARAKGILPPNGEWKLKPPEEMALLWSGWEGGLEESLRIADECDFQLSWARPALPAFDLPEGFSNDDEYLRYRVETGTMERWPDGVNERARARIEHELGVIRRLGFAGFFLIMWKAMERARELGILCQGRGSAANSVVAFCLQITAVDPVKEGLLFERFLSEGRVRSSDGHSAERSDEHPAGPDRRPDGSPEGHGSAGEEGTHIDGIADGPTEAPDIDVDFEMHRREEILDHVYNQYDREYAAITGVTQIYSAPTALQDSMRALGYPAELIFRLSRQLHRVSAAEGADALASGQRRTDGFDPTDPRGRAVLTAMRGMEDLPRMRSTHPGGFVLSSEPLGDTIPIEWTTMGRSILQFDKDDLDAVGVPKFDFLGIGGLTATRLAFDAIEQYTGRRLDLYTIPGNDRETFEMIARGDTIGTFQIESRAQIASIVQTRPEKLYDLVVQVSLVRPGPIQARFVQPYTRRRRGLETPKPIHPDIRHILERTCGIPVFQEQAMAISMVLGGYTAAEADALRRSMGNQRKLPRLKNALGKLRERMIARGVDAEVADTIATDFESFSNYGFPESHAWSYALIAYATAYLKRHYPAAFLLGLLNAWPMGFYAPSTLVHDARRAGVTVLPPCVAAGDWDSTLEDTANPGGPAVRVGWSHIRGIGSRSRDQLRRAHTTRPFNSIEDTIRRAGLGRSEALHLARAGAFENFEPGRRAAAWEALRAAGDLLPLAPSRFFPFQPEELEGEERIFLDYLATGICVTGHPMEHLRGRLDAAGVLSSRTLGGQKDGEFTLTSGLVIARQHPPTAKGTVFLLLEDEFGYINVIVPAPLYQREREMVRSCDFLLVEGRFERNESILNVVARRFRRLKTTGLKHRSHDFH
ncbi:MAG: PHP domain-containing protein [Gemmatimonadota bacterium]|jgi:error-prone DNA polymerase|nr:PHP domain-containing protein [Gemmatimonadota bacterium]